MIAYHGTTGERLRSIQASGLRKGSWCSSLGSVAEHFARSRSGWNGERPMVIEVLLDRIPAEQRDRSGRLEFQLPSTALPSALNFVPLANGGLPKEAPC
jgi:hypothetical protein